MRWIDCHCHLYMDPLGSDALSALRRAEEAGVARVVVPAYDLASWGDVARLAQEPRVAVMLGLHPWAADEELNPGRLNDALSAVAAVGIGEIGLDSKVDPPGPERQRHILRQQLDLAVDLDLPVSLHCRGAFEELLDILSDYRPRLRGMVHAFSRGPELAQRFLDLGLHLSFGGAITRPRAKRPRRSARSTPLERVLLETDAPSIGLEGVPPEQVEPAHTAQVGRALAELRSMAAAEVARVTTANAHELFGLT